MTESCVEEHERLLRRTEELKAQTEALDLSVREFSQTEHDALRESIRQHQSDLADHRRRCLGPATRR